MSAEQLSLEVPTRILAHTEDVETSHQAAAVNLGSRASHRRACLEMHAHGQQYLAGQRVSGFTDDEIAIAVGLELIEARRRCSDLRNLGLIAWLEFDGKPVARKTHLGCRARVSVITQAGREALA